MKKILILGGNSFTGFYINKLLSNDFELYNTSRNDCDGGLIYDAVNDDIVKLAEYLKSNHIDVLVNCISNGDVDSCEENPDFSEFINLNFVKEITSLVEELGIHLIHFSTNAIYDGLNAPYSENDDAEPINKYGQIKKKADVYIENNAKRYTILRPITMYGIRLKTQRHNPFSYFYEQCKNDKDIIAVNDVYVNMLFVEDLVECVKSSILNEIYGTYNISGKDVVNRYEFVSLIKSYLPESKSVIKSVSSLGFKTAAERPKNTSFNNKKMIDTFGFQPENIEVVIKNLVLQLQSSD
jgi:dTDP-4-dehydrorhamnose reductase